MLKNIYYFAIMLLISTICVATIKCYSKPTAPATHTTHQDNRDINNKEQLAQEDEWDKHIRNLPQTFGTQYYNWLQNGEKIGYMVLSIKDAKYEGQEVFKVKGKWVVNKPVIGFAEITSYAKKNKYLTPLYEEVKGSEGLGFATFDMKLKIQNGKGTITGEAKAVGQTTSLNNTIDIPADMITWEGGFICATVLPTDENLSYSYSIFAICEKHGFDKLKTEPLKFAGKEEITYKNGKVECNKFIGKLRESNVYFWVDKNRRLIKGLAGDNDEINLTDKNDALTMPEDKTKQGEKKKDIKTGKSSWSGAHSKIKEEGFYLIKTKEEWVKMWHRHSPDDNIPEINFADEMCVGIFAGKRWNSHGITAVSVTEETDKILFRYEHLSYQTSGGVDKVTPFGIFILPHSDKPVVIQEQFYYIIGGAPLCKTKKILGENSEKIEQSLLFTPTGLCWVKQLGTKGNDNIKRIAIDTSGYIYATGDTEGGFDGQPNASRTDVWIAKFDPTGNPLWHKQFGNQECDEAIDIAIDHAGNICVCGHSWSRASSWDVFIAKYSPQGDRLWYIQPNTPQQDMACGIAIDSSNSIYIAGTTLGSFDETQKDKKGGFLVKYNSDSAKQWIHFLEGEPKSVFIDSSDNIVVCGSNIDTTTRSWQFKTFISKYNSIGEKQWSNELPLLIHGQNNGVTTDVKENIYLCASGELEGKSITGYGDIFVIKYNADGIKEWLQQSGTPGDDETTDIAVDVYGNIYICGYTSDCFDDNRNSGCYDSFVIKYDTEGNKIWTKQLGTNEDDRTSGIALDNNGDIYICGYTNAGSHDAFIVKFQGK